jgi:hypothetical protein
MVSALTMIGPIEPWLDAGDIDVGYLAARANDPVGHRWDDWQDLGIRHLLEATADTGLPGRQETVRTVLDVGQAAALWSSFKR